MTNYLEWFIEKSKGNKLITFIILFFLVAIFINGFIESIESSEINDTMSYTLVEVSQTTASRGSSIYGIGSRYEGEEYGMGQSFYVDKPGLILEVQIYLNSGIIKNFSTDEIICYLRDSNGAILQNSSINGFYYYDTGWKSFQFNKSVSRGFYIITFHLKNSSTTGSHLYRIGTSSADQSYPQGGSYSSRYVSTEILDRASRYGYYQGWPLQYISTERDFDNWATWHPVGGDLMFKVILRTEGTLSKLENQTLDGYEPFYTDSRSTTDSNNSLTLESVPDGRTSTETKISPPHWAFILFFEFMILTGLYAILNLHERKYLEIIIGIIYIIFVGIIINFLTIGMGIWSLIHPIVGFLMIYQALKSKKLTQK